MLDTKIFANEAMIAAIKDACSPSGEVRQLQWVAARGLPQELQRVVGSRVFDVSMYGEATAADDEGYWEFKVHVITVTINDSPGAYVHLKAHKGESNSIQGVYFVDLELNVYEADTD